MYKDLNKLLSDVKEYSINSLKGFFEILGLDNEIFNHLYNIEITVGNVNEFDAVAEYFPNENLIVILDNYLNNILKEMKDQSLSYKDLISNIAVTLVHEILHANRSMIIAKGLTINNLEDLLNFEANNMENFKIYNGYRNALNSILQKYNINDFKRYIPFWIIFNEDCLVIYSYDKKSKKYVEFTNNNIDKFKQNDKDIAVKISFDIEKNQQDYICTNTYEDIYKKKDIVQTSGDFYHRNSELKQSFKNINDDMSNEEYYDLLIKTSEAFKERFNLLNSLEESMIEGLAHIIVLSKDFDYIDYEYIQDYYDYISFEGQLAIELFKRAGTDFINWFVLSAYEEVYYDMISNTFKDDYENLLHIFDDLYNDKKDVDEVMEEFDNIMNRHLGKTK